jgi:hypothetical protein
VDSLTVVFDACVLYPAPLRDFLMQLAISDLFRAKWTAEIHEEWISHLLANRNDLTRAQLERTRDLMNQAVLDCLVTDYEELTPTLELPDNDDRHVVAAAIHCRAQAIVTFNLKDFPASALAPFDLEAIHPDDFIANLIGASSVVVCAAAKAQRARLKNPPKTADEYLSTLESQGLSQTVNMLRGCAELI